MQASSVPSVLQMSCIFRSSFCHRDAGEGPWNLSFISFMKNTPLSMSLLLDGVPALTSIKNSWKGLMNSRYGPAPDCFTCFPCFIQLIPRINSSNPQNNSQKVNMTIFSHLRHKERPIRRLYNLSNLIDGTLGDLQTQAHCL